MSGARFDPEAIRALAAILTETGLTEIEIAEGDSRIRVVRAQQTFASVPLPPPGVSNLPVSNLAASNVAAAVTEGADLSKHPGAVLSPMVGVVYLAAEPGAAPFVQVGQTVAEGQTLLLIEAMKTFNQIRAPKAGTVARILAAAGAPVEYGEALLILE